MSEHADAVEPQSNEVVLRVDPPTPQSRATIFFRIVLAIPQYVVLYLFSLIATLAGMVGWLVALFTGRLPDGIAEVLRTWTRTSAQVWGYLMLLSGDWPPLVARDDKEYAVDVRFPPSQPLNRLAVLFRLVLVIPAGILTMLSLFGFTVLSFFFWIAALVKGRLPDTVHQAGAATLRYAMRYNAYTWLLTPTYPKGLFGGRTLPLSAGAKRLVAVFVALGALTYGGSVAAAIVFGDFDGLAAQSDVSAAYQQFGEDTDGMGERLTACPEQPDPLACATTTMASLADALSRFHDQVVAIEYPADAQDEAAEAVSAAAAFRDAAIRQAGARSAEEYEALATQSGFETLGDRFDRAYNELINAL